MPVGPEKPPGHGSCPFTALYLSYLERNGETLGANPRLCMPYNTLRTKTDRKRAAQRARAEQAIAELAKATC